MIKVLFFIESLSGGGAEKVLCDIVKGLDKAKYDITVKTVTDNGIYDEEVKRTCKYESILKVKYNQSTFLKKIVYKIKYKLMYSLPAKYIYKLIVRERYDIEIAFVEGYATKIIGSYRISGVKKIAWVHVDPIERSYADNYFNSISDHSECYSSFDRIICVSDSVKRAFLEKYQIEGDKVIKIYNPINKNNIIEKALQYKSNIPKSTFRLVTVGRLVKEKGFDRLLRCISRLKNIDNIYTELIILGEGDLKSQFMEYIKENNLIQNVKLLGFKKNPYPYIASADLFVCSSRAEGFSLVIAEALVLGVPVISTNCSGPNELLEFGESGILVDNNEEALYKALKSVIKNDVLLGELRFKSQKRAKSFEYDQSISYIEDVLQI